MGIKTDDHEVANVHQAVALAREWRNAGSHTWFRGHTKTDWLLKSTLVRIQRDQPEKEKFVTERIAQFCGWLEDVPELKYLLKPQHTDAFFAVLQHYGIPTHYIDFTTRPEIAGFFAACGPEAKPGEMGCIIAIDPDTMVEIGRGVAEVRPLPQVGWPENVSVSVDNLWRLQAQSGHFVYQPWPDIEDAYCYDRILFTHAGTPYDIPEDMIYPKRKSLLEIRLDQFFTAELMANNQIYFHGLFESWRAAGRTVDLTIFEPTDAHNYLVPGQGAHPSWAEVSSFWMQPPAQHFQEAITTEHVALPVQVTTAPSQIAAEVEREILQTLMSKPHYREKAVNWTLNVMDTPPPVSWQEATQGRLARVWDGIRPFPFSNAQLAAALGVTVALSAGVLQAGYEEPSVETLAALLRPTVVIDVVAENGEGYAKAVAGVSALRSAFRDDLDSVLLESWKTQFGDEPRKMLQKVNDPRLLFSVPKLVDLFARQIIPTQVLLNGEGGAVFFSPVQTRKIGSH